MTDDVARLTSALAGRYAIERELGAGGMATVYLARDLRHERAVALKVLRPELGQALGPERFLREITTTAQLAHPHILPLLDSGNANGALYYVMPFVEGETLRGRLSREKQLPLDEALRIAREVADALGYAHSLGVVHRDIKPENILFEAGHAVVADFGIAKAIAAAGSERLTETGLAIGTPAYMSPEQAAGNQDVDGRSDLYSLGCVLYEMLAGEPPFTGPSAQAVVAKRLSTPAPRVSILRKTVPAHVEQALDAALALAAADRFATCAQFAEALGNADAPGHHRTDAPLSRLAWWRRRAVRLAAAGTTVVAVAAIATVLVIRGRGPALDPTIVVVAPFENQTRDTSLAQLGAITADWVAQVLQGTGAIKLVPTAAVVATKWAPGGNPRELAAATGAGTVITGRASLQGDSIYLRADVVRARTGALLYSVPPVAADKRQPLVAVGELARRLGGAVAPILDPGAGDLSLRSRPPTSYEAYRAFVEGERLASAGEFQRSWMEFQRAYALDTNFLSALIVAAINHANATDYAGADSLVQFVERRRDRLTRVQQLRLDGQRAMLAGDYQAATAASRELAQLVPPRWALFNWGYTAVLANRPAEAIHAFTEVSADYQVASDWAPGSANLAAAYHLLGRHKDELKAAQRGRREFPRSLVPIDAALRALAALGRDEDVFRRLDQARGMEPDPLLSPEFWGGAGPWQPYEAALEFREHGHPEAYRRAIGQALDAARIAGTTDTAGVAAQQGLAMVLYAAERWEEARAVYAGLHRADSNNMEFLGGLGVSEARVGHRAEAEALAGRLATINPPYSWGRSPFWRARIAALLGDRDRAVSLLREAIARGISCALRLAGPPMEDCHREMDFESLRGYAPFDELLRPKG